MGGGSNVALNHQFIQELRDKPHCKYLPKDFLNDFLDLIEKRMLIVESPLKEGTGSRRWSSRHVADELAGMVDKHQLAYQT